MKGTYNWKEFVRMVNELDKSDDVDEETEVHVISDVDAWGGAESGPTSVKFNDMTGHVELWVNG